MTWSLVLGTRLCGAGLVAEPLSGDVAVPWSGVVVELGVVWLPCPVVPGAGLPWLVLVDSGMLGVVVAVWPETEAASPVELGLVDG